jgi:transposase-like protein
MDERPEACPACRGTVLIRSGHACGRQRWKCKGPGCGRQFTRTTPRGTPVEVKRHAIELYCLGLSMNAVAKRVGVSAQSMLRWVRDHAHAHCPKPEPARGGTAVVEIDEVWHFVKKSPASSGSGRPSSAGQAG